jgi:hypothetical protein
MFFVPARNSTHENISVVFLRQAKKFTGEFKRRRRISLLPALRPGYGLRPISGKKTII